MNIFLFKTNCYNNHTILHALLDNHCEQKLADKDVNLYMYNMMLVYEFHDDQWLQRCTDSM